MRIDEINTRLSAIQGELDSATGEALAALEQEVADLTAERQQIQNEAQTRQQLRANIAAGITPATIIEKEEKPEMENRTFTPASEEYRSAYLKNMLGRGEEMSDAEKRAFTFLTSNTTAPLPTVMQNRIIDLIGEAHPLVADVYRLDSGTNISIPVAKSIAADAGKTDEGAAAKELEIVFDNVDLSGNDFTANVTLSYKMVNMAIPAFEDYLVSQIAQRIGSKLAEDISNNILDGIINAGNDFEDSFSYSIICQAFGALKRTGTVVAYGNRRTIYEQLVGMVDSQKRPIFQQAITAGVAGTLLGCSIKIEDSLVDGALLIGDPKKYIQNVVAPVVIESAKDLKNHTIVYSGYTCQQGTLTDDKAFARVYEIMG